jgi:hypothetical protein
MPERYDERTVETPVQARQGVTGHNVRYVLAFSTCGVIAALRHHLFSVFPVSLPPTT